MNRNPASIEARAQQRARGAIIRKPDHPIIGCRWTQPKSPENAARLVEWHARWHGHAEPRLQVWRAR